MNTSETLTPAIEDVNPEGRPTPEEPKTFQEVIRELRLARAAAAAEEARVAEEGLAAWRDAINLGSTWLDALQNRTNKRVTVNPILNLSGPDRYDICTITMPGQLPFTLYLANTAARGEKKRTIMGGLASMSGAAGTAQTIKHAIIPAAEVQQFQVSLANWLINNSVL